MWSSLRRAGARPVCTRSHLGPAALATAVLAALLSAAPTSAAPAPAAPAAPAPAAAVAPAAELPAPPGRRGRGTYENPLAPDLPGAGTVDSCADPAVLRGQRPGERQWWYLYCTTDPLNDEDVDEQGEPVFHPVPMLRSRNLVDWRYVGDALPSPPDWAAEGAGIWAPDVAYSRATRRYYLTFVVTDTDDALRGPDACASTGDSAIGVAVSASPTGPWQVSDTPVVPPRPDPAAECGFFWTFDPDVLGEGADPVGRSSVLYYGSYYGGVHGTRVRFEPDGISTTGAPTQVAIGNRYEGSHVVRRGRWHYLFGSATNCCNGPLTAYGVFAGRSRSPLGPFVDREGRSLLAGRVGGTPVLLPNGNRWVGTGHNTVFTDAAGQWWTVYHAVDERDPYFPFGVPSPAETDERQSLPARTDTTRRRTDRATLAAEEARFTKRPALLDRLTWDRGWPEVRAGRWASDDREPAPVVRPRQGADRPPAPVRPLRLGRELGGYRDDFGDGLDSAWSWVREPDPTTYQVSGGALRWQTQPGDLAREVNTASVLTRPAPRGDFAVQTRVRLDLPPEGCCQNYVQAGLLAYADDDRFLKLAHVSIWETRQTEWAIEVPPGPPGYPRYGNGVVGPPGETTTLRIAVQRRPGRDRFTAFTRQDGGRWVRGGTWRHELGAADRIGLVSMGGAGYTAEFRGVRAWRLRAR
ncbi:family 43 glycosylhydrolase [Nocardioides pantholopis]|uniref:family 43 glycosylhydrolase n=1 Tax=Nocardioides pantholopis TaxID=2483798 RepID=UPI000FD92569|nr:family 43 glycosylhydrolase [Nocardioides pantholopis]